MVGSRGGESDEAQLDTVKRILAHLDKDEDPHRYVERLFSSKSITFFRGRTGAWREQFSEQNRRLFNTLRGDVLDLYGYPRD